MIPDKLVNTFLSGYDDTVVENTLKLRKLILSTLPNILEQLDVPAKLIAYTYGQKYSELICVLIPSKKGLKLGFNQGTLLPDPAGILKGTGKRSRYVVIKEKTDISNSALTELLMSAIKLYKHRID